MLCRCAAIEKIQPRPEGLVGRWPSAAEQRDSGNAVA